MITQKEFFSAQLVKAIVLWVAVGSRDETKKILEEILLNHKAENFTWDDLKNIYQKIYPDLTIEDMMVDKKIRFLMVNGYIDLVDQENEAEKHEEKPKKLFYKLGKKFSENKITEFLLALEENQENRIFECLVEAIVLWVAEGSRDETKKILKEILLSHKAENFTWDNFRNIYQKIFPDLTIEDKTIDRKIKLLMFNGYIGSPERSNKPNTPQNIQKQQYCAGTKFNQNELQNALSQQREAQGKSTHKRLAEESKPNGNHTAKKPHSLKSSSLFFQEKPFSMLDKNDEISLRNFIYNKYLRKYRNKSKVANISWVKIRVLQEMAIKCFNENRNTFSINEFEELANEAKNQHRLSTNDFLESYIKYDLIIDNEGEYSFGAPIIKFMNNLRCQDNQQAKTTARSPQLRC